MAHSDTPVFHKAPSGFFDGYQIGDVVIELYEPHGFFKFEHWWILYGHEEIVIVDEFGYELMRQHTR